MSPFLLFSLPVYVKLVSTRNGEALMNRIKSLLLLMIGY